MKVKVISLTQSPVDVLLFTKNTRLNMTADNMDAISKMSKDAKQKELEYMVDTIRSSWEFVDYTVAIEGVTRAFTHQLVRNRHGSYAQQTMRILDVSGFDYLVGPTIEADPDLLEIYCEQMACLNDTYNLLIEKGASIEDARGVLPTNIKTNIVAKFNLRTLAEIISARSSNRTQSEYQDFVKALKEAVVKVTPWAEMFLNSRKHFAAQHLQSYVESNMADKDDKIFTLKMIDLLRK
jgi:flavin-dependent thymidylate synthase